MFLSSLIIQDICSGDILVHHTQQSEGQKQVFPPTPPKAVFPNPKLHDWDLSPSLSERTCNMLRNLERSRWITSYQLQHTGKDAESGITNERGRKCYCAASTFSCRLSQSKLICRRVRASRSSKDRWLQWKRDWPREDKITLGKNQPAPLLFWSTFTVSTVNPLWAPLPTERNVCCRVSSHHTKQKTADVCREVGPRPSWTPESRPERFSFYYEPAKSTRFEDSSA